MFCETSAKIVLFTQLKAKVKLWSPRITWLLISIKTLVQNDRVIDTRYLPVPTLNIYILPLLSELIFEIFLFRTNQEQCCNDLARIQHLYSLLFLKREPRCLPTKIVTLITEALLKQQKNPFNHCKFVAQ